MSLENAAATVPGESRPSLRRKMFFWLLLGMMSTAFAEVLAASDPFPFFHAAGWLIVTPLYFLHVLVLATLLVRHRVLTWPGLLFAGALFGLYEAYITKVLWNPDWGSGLAVAGEVAWLHVVLIALWWHPLFSLILPLLVAETVLTGSRSVFAALPSPWQARVRKRPRRYVALLALIFGITITANAPSVEQAFGAALTNSLVFLFLFGVWSLRGGGTHYTLEDLLPGPRAFKVLAVLLVLYYVVTGPGVHARAIPRAPRAHHDRGTLCPVHLPVDAESPKRTRAGTPSAAGDHVAADHLFRHHLLPGVLHRQGSPRISVTTRPALPLGPCVHARNWLVREGCFPDAAWRHAVIRSPGTGRTPLFTLKTRVDATEISR